MTSSRAYRQAFLLVLITTAAAIDPSSSSSSSSLLRSESSRRSLSESSRRSLTQKTGSNINNNYVTHSEKHTFRTAFLGCCAAVGTLVGLLFLVDKELFNSKCGGCTSRCAKMKCKFPRLKQVSPNDEENDIEDDTNQYVNYDLTKKVGINQIDPHSQSQPWFSHLAKCDKPQISQDEDEIIDEAYITPETKEYLAEKRKPPKVMRFFFPFMYKKEHEDNVAADLADIYKYKREAAVQDDTVQRERAAQEEPAMQDMHAVSEDEETIVSVLSNTMEEVRLRLFWKPTKEYDEQDKYGVTAKESDEMELPPDIISPYSRAKVVPRCPWEDDIEIKPKTSSYESSDSTVVPYK